MKKILFWLLALCMVFALTCAMADDATRVCPDCGETTFKRLDFSNPNSQDSTCCEKGWYTWVCEECAFRDREDIPVKAKCVLKEEITNASCTVPGRKVVTCLNTGIVKEDKVIPPTGHDIVRKHHIEATCCYTGSYQFVCENCGLVDSEETIEALGHDYEDEAVCYSKKVEATCTKPATRYFYCNVTKLLVHTRTWGDPLGHTDPLILHSTTKATCEAAGLEEYRCGRYEDCKYVEYKTLKKLNHKYEWKVTTKPTCEEAGVESNICKNCKDVKETRPVEATKHNWVVDEKLTVDPACDKWGTKVETCTNCKKNLVTPIDPLKHIPEVHNPGESCKEDREIVTYCTLCNTELAWEKLPKVDCTPVKKITKQPTCTAKGEYILVCKYCEKVMDGAVKEEPAKGHAWAKEPMERKATCTETYAKFYCCTAPGCTAMDIVETAPALGHDVDWTIKKQPTCAAVGKKEGTCKREDCKKFLKEDIKKLDHTIVTITSDATAIEHGSIRKICEVCLEEEVTLVHKPGAWTVKTPATCTTEGVEEQLVCTLQLCPLADDKKVTTRKIDKLQHEFVEIEEGTVDSTCTEAGVQAFKCANCDATKTEPIAKKDHVGTGYEVVVEATCTTDGKFVVPCDTCDADAKTGAIPATGHKDGEAVVTTAPTCTEDGEKTTKCTVCEEVTKTEVVPATGHTAGEPEYVVDPDCVTDAVVVVNCVDCGFEMERYTEKAKGHNNTKVLEAVPATCTTTGLTEGLACVDCDAVAVAQEVVAALGHTEEAVAGFAATCTLEGLTDGVVCTVCDAVVVAQEVIPALGHTEVIDAAVAATCTEAGITEGKHCSVCNEVIVAQEVVAALGHDWNAAGYEDPRCVKAGTVYSTCGNCGMDIAEPIKARVSAKDVFVIEAEEDVFTLTIDEALFAEITEAKAKFVHFVVDGLTVCIPVEAITVDATTAFEVQVADGAFTLFTIVNGEATDITEKAEELDVIIEK